MWRAKKTTQDYTVGIGTDSKIHVKLLGLKIYDFKNISDDKICAKQTAEELL